MSDDKNTEIKLLAPIAEHIPQDSKGKVDFFIEIALVFILGILIGIAVKTEAIKRITIGYNDYQIKIDSNMYSINKLQDDLMKKQSSQPSDQANQPVLPDNISGQ